MTTNSYTRRPRTESILPNLKFAIVISVSTCDCVVATYRYIVVQNRNIHELIVRVMLGIVIWQVYNCSTLLHFQKTNVHIVYNNIDPIDARLHSYSSTFDVERTDNIEVAIDRTATATKDDAVGQV